MLGRLCESRLTTVLKPNAPAAVVLDDPKARRLVDAAIAGIVVKGWRSLTMSEVAKRAGVARATIYRYFATKDDLLDAIVLRELRNFMAGSTEARMSATTTEDAMTASLAHTLTFVRDNPMLDRLRETDREPLLEALCDDEIIATAREFSAGMWKVVIHGEGTEVTEAEMTRLRILGEMFSRLTLSLIVNPTTIVDTSAPESVREFARTYMMPLIAATVQDSRTR